MTGILLLEQSLNSLQFGLMLFLLAAGLTLVFGIMDMINLAHGSLYMIGAYLMATFAEATGSFGVALPLALAATALVGAALEVCLLRKLYERDHLTQVLATFAVILIANEAVRMIWGNQSLMLNAPAGLTGPVTLPGGMQYASYRLAIIAVGVVVAVLFVEFRLPVIKPVLRPFFRNSGKKCRLGHSLAGRLSDGGRRQLL